MLELNEGHQRFQESSIFITYVKYELNFNFASDFLSYEIDMIYLLVWEWGRKMDVRSSEDKSWLNKNFAAIKKLQWIKGYEIDKSKIGFKFRLSIVSSMNSNNFNPI